MYFGGCAHADGLGTESSGEGSGATSQASDRSRPSLLSSAGSAPGLLSFNFLLFLFDFSIFCNFL